MVISNDDSHEKNVLININTKIHSGRLFEKFDLQPRGLLMFLLTVLKPVTSQSREIDRSDPVNRSRRRADKL